MNQNIGGLDRIIRIVVGLALLSLIFFVPGEAKWLGLFGVVPLLTAFVGHCPFYGILNVNTCSVKK